MVCENYGANGKFNRNSKKRTKTKSHTTFIIAKNKDIFYVYQYRTNLNNTPATKIWLLKYNGIMYNCFIKTIQAQIESKKVGVIYE
jgi:hypothetical protein